MVVRSEQIANRGASNVGHEIRDLNRSISLGSNAADWGRYQKAKAYQSWLAIRHGIKEGSLPQIIATRKDASSLLRSMGEIVRREST